MERNHAFLLDEKDDLTKLITCIRNKDHSRFIALLNGMDLHFINNVKYEGYTIMQHSVIEGLNEFVDTLLSSNVNANIGDGLYKPVLLAASYGHWKILKTFMILVFLNIILIGLSILKLVWSKNNASMNFRGGKMLNVNSVL